MLRACVPEALNRSPAISHSPCRRSRPRPPALRPGSRQVAGSSRGELVPIVDAERLLACEHSRIWASRTSRRLSTEDILVHNRYRRSIYQREARRPQCAGRTATVLGLDPSTYSPPCLPGTGLRIRDDRGTGGARVPAKPGHLVPVTARIGSKGPFALSETASGRAHQAGLHRDGSGPQGAGGGQRTGQGTLRRIIRRRTAKECIGFALSGTLCSCGRQS